MKKRIHKSSLKRIKNPARLLWKVKDWERRAITYVIMEHLKPPSVLPSKPKMVSGTIIGADTLELIPTERPDA